MYVFSRPYVDEEKAMSEWFNNDRFLYTWLTIISHLSSDNIAQMLKGLIIEEFYFALIFEFSPNQMYNNYAEDSMWKSACQMEYGMAESNEIKAHFH